MKKSISPAAAARPAPFSPVPARTGIERYFAWTAIFFLSGTACVALAAMIHLVVWPYTIEHGEGGCVLSVWRWAAGARLYADAAAGQVPTYNYPPLYAMLLRLGISSSAPFLAGRAINFAAILGVAMMVWFFVHRATGDRSAALAASLLTLVFPETVRCGPTVRVDGLAVFLSVACLLAGWRFAESRAGLVAAALLGTAAWLSKQTAVVAPAALFLWLLIQRPQVRSAECGPLQAGEGGEGAARWANAAWFAGCYVFFMAAAIGLAELLTKGLFLKNVLFYSVSVYSWPLLAGWLEWYATEDRPVHFIAMAGLVLGLFGGRQGKWRESPAVFYLLVCLASLAALGKIGSSRAYFLEFDAACAIGLGGGVGLIRGRAAAARARSYLAAGLLGAGVLSILAIPGLVSDNFDDLPLGVQAAEVGVFRRARGPFLVEDCGFAISAGRTDLDLINPFLANQLFRRGLLDPAPYIANVRNGRYSLIVLDSLAERPDQNTSDRFPRALLEQISRSYRMVGRIGPMHFYSYRPLFKGPAPAEAGKGP